MEYDNSSDRTYAKVDIAKFKTGARVDGDDNFSFLEFSTDAGLEASEWGVSVGAGARAHFFHLGCDVIGCQSERSFSRRRCKSPCWVGFQGLCQRRPHVWC